MLTIEQIREQLADRNLTAVSVACNVNYKTLWRIASGIEDNPTYQILKKLSDYIQSGARACA